PAHLDHGQFRLGLKFDSSSISNDIHLHHALDAYNGYNMRADYHKRFPGRPLTSYRIYCTSTANVYALAVYHRNPR
ncbi:hypothetical protein HAX54_022230, partial [Datura stramonium]|nr:hypothetical protein [Datura stramonium]